MKEGAIRLALTLLLVITVVGGMTGKQEETEITVSGTYEQEKIYPYIRSATADHQPDGSYLVEVEFTTDTPGTLTGMRMVTVLGGGQKTGISLTEENLEEIHRVSFITEKQPETVRVEVRAHQTEAGLLLITDGDGRLCGEAVAPVDGDRILYLSGAGPCETFKIYWIAGLSELLSGQVALSSRPTVKERKAYAVSDRHEITLTTDTDGALSCNFTMEGLEDGIYLAVGERESFYICLPRVEASGELRSPVVRLSLSEKQQNAA